MKLQLMLFLSLAGYIENSFGASQQLPKNRIGRHQHIYTEQELKTLNQVEIKKLHQECRNDISFRSFVAITAGAACCLLCPQALALKAIFTAKAACSLAAGAVAVKSTMLMQDKMVNLAELMSLEIDDKDLKGRESQQHSTSYTTTENTRAGDDRKYKEDQQKSEKISITVDNVATTNTTETQTTEIETKKVKSEAAAFAAATGNAANNLGDLNTPQNQDSTEAPQDAYRPHATTRLEGLDDGSDSETEEINALRILWLHSNQTE